MTFEEEIESRVVSRAANGDGYDSRGNRIHYEDYPSDDRGRVFHWLDYDEHNHDVCFKSSDGVEWVKEYNERGQETHFLNNSGYERIQEYDEEGRRTLFRVGIWVERTEFYSEGGIKTRTVLDHGDFEMYANILKPEVFLRVVCVDGFYV